LDFIHWGKIMTNEMQRRTVLGGAIAGAALLQGRAFAQFGPNQKVIPWSDQPPPVPPPLANEVKGLTRWEDLDSWITPNDKFFSIAHYNRPVIEEKAWRLDVAGMVAKPLTFTLNDLKSLPRQEVTSALECSGSNGFPFNPSLIGNARWAGASLAETLRTAQIRSGALEVVFYGVDQGEEVVRKDTPIELKFTGNFARSMSINDAMNPANLLCYEMNGAPLPAANGFPVRLIAPGWFGVANVKWLRRIEFHDTRFMGRFMGRDYVTVRQEQRNGETLVTETSVGRMLLKSAPAKVTLLDGRYRIDGMAWGPTPVTAVEVKIDNGTWMKATLDDSKSEFAWRSWHLDWSPAPGEHTVTSRAIDKSGNIQPAMDDASIATKKTYWESNGQITRHIRVA
jgi:DMSO/TMAO reductase YedYZ molybdopterin-dependent catalytic subunit